MTRFPIAHGLVPLLLMTAGCSTTHEAEATTVHPVIDPSADEILRGISQRWQAHDAFSLHVVDMMDEFDETGQMLQFTHVRDAVVARPDKLMIRSRGDRHDRVIWKDGRTVTILDEDENVYVQLDDPGTIEEMMDVLLEEYGISTPLADFISTDPYTIFMDGVLSVRRIGRDLVGETPCDHVAVRTDTLDWQIWVNEDMSPAVRKMVLTYKRQPGCPQYTLRPISIDILDTVPEATFQADLPEDAERVELTPLGAERSAP